MPQILKICHATLHKYKNDKIGNSNALERSSILALCKIMCVSSEICAQNLPLIFGLLKS